MNKHKKVIVKSDSLAAVRVLQQDLGKVAALVVAGGVGDEDGVLVQHVQVVDVLAAGAALERKVVAEELRDLP